MGHLREILSTHQRLTIEYNVKEHNHTQRRHHLRLRGQPEPEHHQICQRLNLKKGALPRKITAAK